MAASHDPYIAPEIVYVYQELLCGVSHISDYGDGGRNRRRPPEPGIRIVAHIQSGKEKSSLPPVDSTKTPRGKPEASLKVFFGAASFIIRQNDVKAQKWRAEAKLKLTPPPSACVEHLIFPKMSMMICHIGLCQAHHNKACVMCQLLVGAMKPLDSRPLRCTFFDKETP